MILLESNCADLEITNNNAFVDVAAEAIVEKIMSNYDNPCEREEFWDAKSNLKKKL
ncbi:MAG: hypothetical protein ACOYL6_12740 [Bacteriovoracaceae bacterium]